MRMDSLHAEIQAMKYAAASKELPATGQRVGADFSALLNKAINNVNHLAKTSSHLQTRFDQGDDSLRLSDVMIARNKSSVAFEATIEVRNKLVEAYKELMNMPV